MAIPDEDVAKVRQATDLAALIGEHTSLRRVGRRFVGLCPFHEERSPSFSVNVEEGLYYCFGCQASGDAITFVRAIEGCDFVEAVERLASRAGVSVRLDDDPGDALKRSRRQQLYEVLEKAATYYHEVLLSNDEAKRARQYLRSRGYDGTVVRNFGLGYAPSAFDQLVRHLRATPELLKEAGLGYLNRRGRLQDSFRDRIIFPIYDPGGRVIALGGRVLPEPLRTLEGEPGPKYRNSPESSVYQKRATLYGLNWSKGAIAKSSTAVVCEGYTDVIGLFSSGVESAVATCGTALTEDHFRLLSRFAKTVVLCFDADNAGTNAAARLYEWERKHELELQVAALPSGSDPGELAHSDPARLREAIDGARPFLGFRVERALSRFDLRTPEARAGAARAALQAICEHPNDLVRDQYLIEVADRTRLAPERLRELLSLLQRERHDESSSGEHDSAHLAPSAPLRSGTASVKPELRVGRNALMLAIHRPESVRGQLSPVLFGDEVQREAFCALQDHGELRIALEATSPDAAELLRQLVVTDGADAIDPLGTIVRLTQLAAQVALSAIEARARLAVARGDQKLLNESASNSRFVKEQLEHLLDPVLAPGRHSEAIDASKRLLAWLEQQDKQDKEV